MRADARYPQLLLDSEPQVSSARREAAVREGQEGARVTSCSHAIIDLSCSKRHASSPVVYSFFISADVSYLYGIHAPPPHFVQVEDPEFVPARQTTKLVPRIESV